MFSLAFCPKNFRRVAVSDALIKNTDFGEFPVFETWTTANLLSVDGVSSSTGNLVQGLIFENSNLRKLEIYTLAGDPGLSVSGGLVAFDLIDGTASTNGILSGEVLTADVPLPAGFVLLGAGLFALHAWRRPRATDLRPSPRPSDCVCGT